MFKLLIWDYFILNTVFIRLDSLRSYHELEVTAHYLKSANLMLLPMLATHMSYLTG